MKIMQSRRRFVSNAAVAGAAGFGAFGALSRGGGGTSLAAEPPPEISTIRLEKLPVACLAPQYVAEELLHAEGFTEVRYVAAERCCRRRKWSLATKWIGPWISHPRLSRSWMAARR